MSLICSETRPPAVPRRAADAVTRLCHRPRRTVALIMTLTLHGPLPGRTSGVGARQFHSPGLPGPSELPHLVTASGSVVAMRRKTAITHGGLAGRGAGTGDRLVTARDLDGASWWIAADAVWSDAAVRTGPLHPRPVGMSSAANLPAAVMAGLSDRLGWEAVHEFGRGVDLPTIDMIAGPDGVVLLDGRLHHDVPTIIVLGRDVVRWGAGATWDRALHRALFGNAGRSDVDDELAKMAAVLANDQLRVAEVDLGTTLLRRSGAVRCSVQLLHDDAVRPGSTVQTTPRDGRGTAVE